MTVAQHVVEQGECMASIAAHRGFDWRTLWDHPKNAKLKKSRKDPNILYPGDVVFVPEKTARKIACAAGTRHRFVHKSALETLRIRLLDEFDRPRAKVVYELVIDGEHRPGKTNNDGELVEKIRPLTMRATLFVGEERQEMTLRLGGLDPPETISGVQARLTNLGYDAGPCDGVLGSRTRQALTEFQEAFGLQPTGELNDDTIAALTGRHGR
jgi:N-acetylmuramoyl-L-alanine amidase